MINIQIIHTHNEKLYSLHAKQISLDSVHEKILHALAKKPSYPRELAQRLGMHEQNIYYHIRNLEKKGFIRVMRKEERGAAMAKIYTLTSKAFFTRFGEFTEVKRIPRTSSGFLYPFVSDGKINTKIVVGSPDPHGPERARSRDAYYAIDIGLFLGTFITHSKACVVLDTEINKDYMKENMIIIGGPVINRITKTINNKLPIRFDTKKNIYSSFSKKIYRSDDCGIICKITNPFNKQNKILVIAGRRYSGTRAAILAFLNNYHLIKKSHVVEGIDTDFDGVIDDVRFLE